MFEDKNYEVQAGDVTKRMQAVNPKWHLKIAPFKFSPIRNPHGIQYFHDSVTVLTQTGITIACVNSSVPRFNFHYRTDKASDSL